MFIAAPSTIIMTWKQPKCPSKDEWIKKIQYIHVCVDTHTMDYYAATKKNELVPFAGTWIFLEIIILSEVSQTGKDRYHTILPLWGI